MLYWLTFLQSLPTLSELESTDILDLEVDSQHQEETIIAQSVTSSSVQPTVAQIEIGGALFFPALIAGFVLLLILSIWAFRKVYVIAPNNEAFVKTGGLIKKDKEVILNGGCIVLPGFHEITRVPLREISIDVERTGNLAVRTQDYLRANMRVTFYVCISPNKQDVLIAAARLSENGRISEDNIKEAIEKRADDAIRAAAKRKSIAEIDSDKLGFADEVLNLIQQDLKKVGLTLNNIAISEIEESDSYDTNNFFDAQGVRLRTETIQRSIEQKQEVELRTRVQMEQRDLNAEKQSLRITQEKEQANLDQQLEIEALKAQREREIQERKDQESAKVERNKILQKKAVDEEQIQQKLALQQSQIVADIDLEERNKQLKVAQTLQKQEAEVAEITRQQTIDASRLRAQVQVAEAERESKIAQQEVAIAIAEREKARFAAEAERAQAESAVQTATEVEEAEREQRLSLIAAQQEAEKKRIADQNVVEIDVFRRRRQAEIARQAAELEAESILTLAEANRKKALADAEGKRALIDAENALSDANRTAELIKSIFPEIAPQLPEIIRAIAPQPGILGDARIYAFPGANGNNGNGHSNGMGDINKLLLSTSGLSMINALLDEGKLGSVLGQMKDLLQSNSQTNGQVPLSTPPVAEKEEDNNNDDDDDDDESSVSVTSIEASTSSQPSSPSPTTQRKFPNKTKRKSTSPTPIHRPENESESESEEEK